MAHMERRGQVHTGFWWGHPTERDYLEDLGLNGKIILKLIFKKGDGRRRLDEYGSEYGQVAGSCIQSVPGGMCQTSGGCSLC